MKDQFDQYEHFQFVLELANAGAVTTTTLDAVVETHKI
jgi:uncharacterized protein with GYD domain